MNTHEQSPAPQAAETGSGKKCLSRHPTSISGPGDTVWGSGTKCPCALKAAVGDHGLCFRNYFQTVKRGEPGRLNPSAPHRTPACNRTPRSLFQHVGSEGRLRQCKGYRMRLFEGFLALAQCTHSSGPTSSLLFISTLALHGPLCSQTSAGRSMFAFLKHNVRQARVLSLLLHPPPFICFTFSSSSFICLFWVSILSSNSLILCNIKRRKVFNNQRTGHTNYTRVKISPHLFGDQ